MLAEAAAAIFIMLAAVTASSALTASAVKVASKAERRLAEARSVSEVIAHLAAKEPLPSSASIIGEAALAGGASAKRYKISFKDGGSAVVIWPNEE